MKKMLLCAAVLPAILAACATGPETPSATSNASLREEKEFTTGSNVPRRNRMGGDPISVMTREEFERARTSGVQGTGGTGSSP